MFAYHHLFGKEQIKRKNSMCYSIVKKNYNIARAGTGTVKQAKSRTPVNY